jgi:CelD/BcsL family acetyltransferase involved in cellulose biosynthesis
MRVRVHEGEVPDALATLAAAPAGSFFQSPAWMQAVIAAEPRFAPLVVAVEGDAGEWLAACPFLVARRLGVLCLYAGARGTYGGILARDARAAALAREHVAALARSLRVALVRIHDFAATLAGLPWTEREESCQVLDLPVDPEVLFRDAFTSQNRNKIRKAEKLGLEVRRSAGVEALERYADLYAESAARWGIRRPLPRRFFRALAGAPGVDVWLAEKEGAALAALLNFTWGGQVMNWGNVSRRDAWSASPNNLLHWRALAAACRDPHGPRLYNFGSSAGLPGVETFKSAFGARTHAYVRREHRAAWWAWAASVGRPRR